jgi:hypothetical protein
MYVVCCITYIRNDCDPVPALSFPHYVSSGSNSPTSSTPSSSCAFKVSIVQEVYRHVSVWRMPSSGMLRRVALVRTDVSEQRISSAKRVTRIGELGTLLVTSDRNTPRRMFQLLVNTPRSVIRLLVTANVAPR